MGEKHDQRLRNNSLQKTFNNSSLQGVQEWSDGRKYQGEFKDNLMNGFGFYLFSDGKTYEGQYFNDKKHGYGIYKWSDGKQYQGWWTMGKQEGYGIFVSPDGQKKYGIWKDGKKQGWLNEEQIQNMNAQLEKAKKERKIKREEWEKMTFERPEEFNKRAARVKDKVQKIIDNKHI